MEASPQREPEINKLFRAARKLKASDLYLEVGATPCVKLGGVNRYMEMRPLSQDDIIRLTSPILYPEQLERLAKEEDIAFTYAVEEMQAYHVEVRSKGGQLSLSAHWLGTT